MESQKRESRSKYDEAKREIFRKKRKDLEKLLESIQEYGTLEGGVSDLTQEMIDNPPEKNNLSLLVLPKQNLLG